MGGEPIPFLIGGNSAMYVRLSDSKLPPINESELVLGPQYLPIVKKFLGQIGSSAVMAVPMLSRLPDYAVEVSLRFKEILGYGAHSSAERVQFFTSVRGNQLLYWRPHTHTNTHTHARQEPAGSD
jgi:hypothetical protein